MRVDIAIEDDAWRNVPDLAATVAGAVEAALAAAGLPADASRELSVLLAGDAAMRVLNRDWRGRDAATNVLSFPQPAAGPLVGDIALGFGTVAREAAERGIPFDHHIAHLVVHGLLHLFGYDHERPDEAAMMEATERAALAALGIADPYADDAQEPRSER